MADQRNLTEDLYFQEEGKNIGFGDPIDKIHRNYDFNISAARMKLQQADLLGDLLEHLNRIGLSYAGGRPQYLFFYSNLTDLAIFTKPFSSVLNKIFRVNYLENKNFPSPPSNHEFINIYNLFEHPKMNDLLRGRLVCKYMDGPQAVAAGLRDFCSRRGLSFQSYPRNNDRGYYAWHCYIGVKSEIMVNADVTIKTICFEIQITTQLAELITGLTHGLYEVQRATPPLEDDHDWRWQPKTQRFRSTYIGHTLHLLEGIIQMFRDEVLEIDSKNGEIADHGDTLLVEGTMPSSKEDKMDIPANGKIAQPTKPEYDQGSGEASIP
jgi:hypothetical protein